MPLGGIGAGCVCLTGFGGLQDFSIRHHPDKSSLPVGHQQRHAAFAVLRLPAQGTTRLVEGPMPIGLIYSGGLRAQGNLGGGYEGFPRFRNCEFRGEYPFGHVRLTDPALPLEVEITGFSPFIPLDVKHSAMPCLILEYTLRNPSGAAVDYEFSYHLSHLAPGPDERHHATSRTRAMPGQGIYFYNTAAPTAPSHGSASLAVVGHTPKIKAMWFRGSWFDGLSVLWRELETGAFTENTGSPDEDVQGRNGGSLLLQGRLEPGASITYPLVLAWHFPNADYAVGGVAGTRTVADGPAWRPYYVNHWQNAAEVAQYACAHYARLRARTGAFHAALFASTLPAYVLDAVSANLAILKSPTVLLQENGNLWAWEGCFPDQGCCPGSCTHVWNYAQAFPNLYPQLERTFREQELLRSMDERGHVTFRAALPDGPPLHDFHAASDGQLGGVLKVFRDWQISGDAEWMRQMYPLARRSLDYCIETWDPQRKGVLEEPHHNTYDIEFWGPDGMCSSFYLGALAAMSALAAENGDAAAAQEYAALAARGAAYLDAQLFNGEYYYQKVTYAGLRDTSLADYVAQVDESSSAEDRLLKAEGPKYQYGPGCISDGVMGVWLSAVCQVATPQTRANVRRNLRAIFEYNFTPSLAAHANPQRPGYALGDEPGLLLCTWPNGGKPTLPFVYSDEVWTGIEYQVAAHLISEGMLREGLTLVHAARSRYNGRTRNPWDEYECGSYYARALASYDLLRALSGFQYSAVSQTLRLAPKLPADKFCTFFSTASGWGTITLAEGAVQIDLAEGTLAVDRLEVTLPDATYSLAPGAQARAGERLTLRLAAA